MSGTLAEQTERPPAQYLGLARDFRRRVAAELMISCKPI